jgi:hypothetical protein
MTIKNCSNYNSSAGTNIIRYKKTHIRAFKKVFVCLFYRTEMMNYFSFFNHRYTNLFHCLGSCQVPLASMVAYVTSPYPAAIASGDFNGDNQTDLILTSNGNAAINILLGYGNGTFAAPIVYPTGFQPYWIAVHDLNGDNRLDIAATSFNSNILGIFLNNGNGSFSVLTTYATGRAPIPNSITNF